MDPSSNRPDIITYGEAFLFGLLVPSLSFLLMLSADIPHLNDLILLPWLGIIVFGGLALSRVRSLPADALLGGGIIGVIVSWLFLFALIDTDLIFLIMGFIAAAAMAGATLLTVLVSWSWSHRETHITAIAAILVISFVVIILGLVIRS